MVNLFFVISGFIITYILLKEKKERGTINLKHFYIKRMLRIWPLYFGILAAVLLLTYFTNIYYLFGNITTGSLLFFLLFAINFSNSFALQPLGPIPHYWSLSVEEQFYLYWPFVVKYLNVAKFSLLVIIGWVFFRNLFAFQFSRTHIPIYGQLNDFFLATKFPSMAIGALGAVLQFNNSRLLKYIVSPLNEMVLWGTLLFSIFFKQLSFIPYAMYEVFAVFYILLILNLVNKTKSFTESKTLDTTGKFSYGLYMFHWPLIPLLTFLLYKIGLLSVFSKFYYIPFVLFCYCMTYLISWFSFKYFESYFLKMKPKN